MFDYNNPNYSEVFADRAARLNKLKKLNNQQLEAVKQHYRFNPWDFVADWGMTFEPRNIERGLLATIPFIPWERQND